MSNKLLSGNCLEKLPVRYMNTCELAKLYAFLVQKYGEDNSLTLEPIEELEKRKNDYEEGYEEGYKVAKGG